MERQGMLISTVITVFTTLHFTLGSNYCDLSSNYFQWLDENSLLVLPASYAAAEASWGHVYRDCDKRWETLPHSPSCTFCAINNAVVCYSTRPYRVPEATSLPVSNISVYRLSGALVSLPPRSFSGLNIQQLIIESTNITFVGHDTFAEVESIKFLFLRNNSFEFLSQAGDLFQPLRNLEALSLADNELKTLLSYKSAALQKLEYFSLKGNTIDTLDLFFLQNSSLNFLDLSYVTFKESVLDMEDTGFPSLPRTLNKIDLSHAKVSVRVVRKMLNLLHKHNITMLNVGYLKAAPRILPALCPVKDSLQFLTLEGTDLSNTFSDDTTNVSFDNNTFVNVIELNMRNCKIKIFGRDAMRPFPNIKVLSLAENLLTTLDLSAFFNLDSLNVMDLRSIYITDIRADSNSTVESLQVMDLSSAEFYMYENSTQNIFSVFPNLQRLSLCNADVTPNLIWAIGKLERLKYLDLSSTLLNSNSLLSAYCNLFSAVNLSSLTELYFARNNFKTSSNNPLCFSSLKSLKTLDFSNNLIRELSQDILGSSVDTLNLSQNLITTWYSPVIHPENQIKFLDLSNNQVTYVSDAMVHDFYILEFLNLSENPLMCHNKVVAMVCADVKNETHNLTMLSSQEYKCYDIVSNNYRLFSEPKECDAYYEEVSTTSTTPKYHEDTHQTPEALSTDKSAVSRQKNFNTLITVGLVSMAAVSATIGCIVYFKWWSIRCYVHRYFTLRRAHLLRKEGPLLGKPDIHYDVFVSYSDVDRSWILDHLIPNMEADGDVTLCFHERDFQVGLSILENIIECMDRSHSILLIVSSGFVRSKWCQFEMHLAQYRLIETLRNQLVLVLLEDIPRKSRPSVLHHLMMTKTYLVWPHNPCKDDAKELFWRRLKRALKPNYSHIFGV